MAGGGALTYLVERADAWLEDHVGVEEKGAQQRLGVAGELRDDPNQEQVDVQGVLQHVLQLGQDHADERACRKHTGVQGGQGARSVLPRHPGGPGATAATHTTAPPGANQSPTQEMQPGVRLPQTKAPNKPPP